MAIQYIKEGIEHYCSVRKIKFKFQQLKVTKSEEYELREKAKLTVGDETFVLTESHDDEFCVIEGTVKGPKVIQSESSRSIYPVFLAYVSGKTISLTRIFGELHLVFSDIETTQSVVVRGGTFADIGRLAQLTYLDVIEEFAKDGDEVVQQQLSLFFATYFHPSLYSVEKLMDHAIQFQTDVYESNTNTYRDVTIHFDLAW